ncbi:MAG TPA: Ig-like domain-containing protein [Nocardioidaceae bacterium]|nr:Ig-like domain-containing protein [Nocardioidaceae bacterium]
MTAVRSHRQTGVGTVLPTLLVAALAVSTASCQARGDDPPRADAPKSQGTPMQPTQSAPTTAVSPAEIPPRLTVNVTRGAADVAVDTTVAVEVDGGRLTRVRVTPRRGGPPLAGSLAPGEAAWRASELLEPDTTYQVEAHAVSKTGERAAKTVEFRTVALTLDEQTYPAFTPVDGATVGVGMPAIVHFDVPVTDRASIEARLDVTSTPRVEGSWHWVNDNEVHWRPKRLWPVGAEVHVTADINGVDAGNGIYGQHDRSSSFTVGDSIISKVNVATHQMRVFRNGTLARTIPITAGKPGFETRSGTKIIVEKVRTKQMDAATIGIERDDPEYYNIPDVQFAMRVTYTGEFLHAAPWSVSDQGRANVSHGCIGMSLDNARWLYEQSHPGDLVKVTGTERQLEYGNGWTDWNVSFKEYKAGSALS